MEVSWDKVEIGDVVECEDLGYPAVVYYVDQRGVFVCPELAAVDGRGHNGSSSGVKSPIGGPYGHWNLWKDEYPTLTIVRRAKKFKGNN